jgi:hypothetical protein
MLIAVLWRRLARLLRRGLFWRSAQICETVGESQLVYRREPPPFLREYHDYCIGLFRAALRAQPRSITLLFDAAAAPATPVPPLLRVAFQWEHTLVLPGGRDSGEAVPGRVATQDGRQAYLARVARRAELEAADIVVEYSCANVENIQSSGQFAALSRKLLLLAPLLHTLDFRHAGRHRALLTLFADTRQPRRAALLRQARAAQLPLRNVRGIYDRAGLQRLYRGTRVLINAHQTDHHHTLEELRVLPALQSGVIVVSEDVPLRDRVPYHEFIIWAPYEQLLQTAQAVLADFDAMHARIFGDGRLRQVLQDMQQSNSDAVAAMLAAQHLPRDR